MSFSFGFGGDDIEDDGSLEERHSLADEMSKYTISGTQVSFSNTIAPKGHTLQDLLQHTPSQISYNTLTLPQPTAANSSAYVTSATKDTAVQIQRRSLFDIRAQLMAEADLEEHDNGSENLLAGLENGDLTSGVYEGGFKTWECALDLASLCTSIDFETKGVFWDVIELGAGSAIPSLAILQSFMGSRATNTLSMTLCDYNEDVLRLATAPNVLLNYFSHSDTCKSSGASPSPQRSTEEGEFDVEELGPVFAEDMSKDLLERRIAFNFISGGWGDAFIDLFASLSSPRKKPSNLLILASETIYSPNSTRIFADTLMHLFRQHRQSYPDGDARAWIAAKKVYFGVGGGVDDFTQEVQQLGGAVKTVLETHDTGVGRVILEVTVVL